MTAACHAPFAVIKIHHAVPGHHLSAAEVRTLTTPAIAKWIVSGLAPTTMWLWMARANGEGRNWARRLSTVLFCRATLLDGQVHAPDSRS